jgi:1-acyl-sn-glycerol-3-phosphate acyltransferase
MRKAPEPVRRWTWPHYYFGAWLTRTLCRLLGGYHIHGREHIPPRGGAVLCANHISYLDPPVLGAGFTPRRTYFMAKKELFEVPILRELIRKCYAFPVDRGATDREAIRHAIELLQAGELLVVFPEGGRSPDGSLQPGNIGPALMASRAGVPIIPVAIKGTDQIMPPGKGGLHRGRVYVDYGAPLAPEAFTAGRADKAALQDFTEAVMQAIEQLQKQQYERVGEVAPPRVRDVPTETEQSR